MNDKNDPFPMKSAKAAKMVASSTEIENTNWNSMDTEATTSKSSESLSSLSMVRSKEEKYIVAPIIDQDQKLEGSNNNNDYSYFDTISLVIDAIHVVMPAQQFAVICLIPIVSGFLIALVWSHVLSHVSQYRNSQFSMSNSEAVYNLILLQDEYAMPNPNQQICAPWLPPEQRNILILKEDRLNDWKTYQDGKGYTGDEGYWTSSLIYVLRSLGFNVQILQDKEDGRIAWGSEEDLSSVVQNDGIYRVFVEADYSFDVFTQHQALHDTDLLCKFRFLHWDNGNTNGNGNGNGNTNGSNNHTHKDASISPYKDARSVVTPFSYHDINSTTIPFFVHSQVTLPPLEDLTSRGRKVLLLDKSCSFSKTFLVGFIEAGYELHLICSKIDDSRQIDYMIPTEHRSQVIYHSLSKPSKFASIARTVSLIIDTRSNNGSSSNSSSSNSSIDNQFLLLEPMEGLANGASFLKPTASHKNAYYTSPLDSLAAPYVYNYKVQDNETLTVENIIEMAEIAVFHPFGSFIPFHQRFDVVRGQVCAELIASDSLCQCSKINNGIDLKQNICMS